MTKNIVIGVLSVVAAIFFVYFLSKQFSREKTPEPPPQSDIVAEAKATSEAYKKGFGDASRAREHYVSTAKEVQEASAPEEASKLAKLDERVKNLETDVKDIKTKVDALPAKIDDDFANKIRQQTEEIRQLIASKPPVPAPISNLVEVRDKREKELRDMAEKMKTELSMLQLSHEKEVAELRAELDLLRENNKNRDRHIPEYSQKEVELLNQIEVKEKAWPGIIAARREQLQAEIDKLKKKS